MQKVYSKDIWQRASWIIRNYDYLTDNPHNPIKHEVDYWLGQESSKMLVSAIGGCVLLPEGTFHRVMFFKYGYDHYMVVFRKKAQKPSPGHYNKPLYNIDYLVSFQDGCEGNRVWNAILHSNTNDARTKYGALLYKFTMPSNI